MDITTLRIVAGVGSIVIAISLHEMMHAYVGFYLGDDTAKAQGRLTINPLAHIDIFTTVLLPLVLLLQGLPPIGAAKPVPFNPYRVRYGEYGSALIAAAGPLTNLLLAIIGSIGVKYATNIDIYNTFMIFTAVNIGFFVFNLLPIPPLDGSRVLYAFAPQSIRNFMDSLERLGLIMMLVLFFFAYPFLRPLLSWANNSVLNLIF